MSKHNAFDEMSKKSKFCVNISKDSFSKHKDRINRTSIDLQLNDVQVTIKALAKVI